MSSDLRYAFRQFARSPGFTAIAVFTLALGVAACAAIFSVVNGVLLRPLAYPEPDRLVQIRETDPPRFPDFSVAPGNYFSWLEQVKCFESLAASGGDAYNLTGHGEPLRLNARRVTTNYLATLQIRPMLGRDFQPGEDAPDRSAVALLTYGLWQRRFGGRRDISGTTIELDGRPFTIAGVLPKNFQPEARVDLLTPAVFRPRDRENHGEHFLDVVGRLKPGVPLIQARSELNVIAARLAQQFPASNKGWRVTLTPLLESSVAGVRPVLFALLGAVGFLLLIACTNIANLLLARSTFRTREICLRAALGASRLRIVRQLLTESVLLAGFGTALGVLLAWWSLPALLAFAPNSLPRAAEIYIDGRVVGFAAALALATGVGFGLVPALYAARINLVETLKGAGRGMGDSRRQWHFRSLLVIAEIALALVLLVGAGLLIRSLALLERVDPGFQPHDAWTVSLSLSRSQYGSDSQRAAFVSRAAAALAAIPGVESAGGSHEIPFFHSDYILPFSIAGRPRLDPSGQPVTNCYSITPGYFRAMGIPLLRGRFFDDRDVAGAPPVAIINETMAKQYFPHEDPLGQRLAVANGSESFRTIVGIVGNVKIHGLDTLAPLQTYEAFAQQPFPFIKFTVRTAGLATGLPAAIRAAIYSVDKGQPVSSILPFTELIADSFARRRFTMFLFSVFSLVALLLAGLGIYGVMIYTISRRTAEIGLRMALGAQRTDVLRLVLAQGGRLVVLGLAAGMIGALLLTRLLASLLYGVSAHDPLTFAAIATLLATIAIFACYLPARRATKIDPIKALRVE